MRRSYDETRAKSSFLFTVVLAVGGRFYGDYKPSFGSAGPPILSHDQRQRINQLAHTHLSASLFCKEFQLADLQAVLILSVWNLEESGRAPDQWILHGHCGQLAYRIGLDNIATQGQSLFNSGLEHPDVRSALERWATLFSWKT